MGSSQPAGRDEVLQGQVATRAIKQDKGIESEGGLDRGPGSRSRMASLRRRRLTETTSRRGWWEPCGYPGKSTPGGGNSKCRGPGVGGAVAEKSWEASVVGTEGESGRGGRRGQRAPGGQACRALQAEAQPLGFTLSEMRASQGLS